MNLEVLNTYLGTSNVMHALKECQLEVESEECLNNHLPYSCGCSKSKKQKKPVIGNDHLDATL